MKRSLSRSLTRADKIERGPAVHGVDELRCPWRSVPGAIAVPSARSRQSSIRNTSSRSTAAGLALGDDQRQRPRWPRRAVAEQPQVTHEGAGRAQWNLEGFLGARRRRRAAREAARPPTAPSIPRQFRTIGAGRSLPNAISGLSPRLNRRSRTDERPYRGVRLSRAQGEDIGLGPKQGRAGRAPGLQLAPAGPPDRGPPRPIRPAARVGPVEKC